MPTSHLPAVPLVITALDQTLNTIGRPASVLDIGPGHGKYGLLAREYCGARIGHLAALEAEPRYVAAFPWLTSIYDQIRIGRLEDIATHLTTIAVDVALLIDVLEHVTHDEGLAALDALHAAGATVILCTPRHYFANDDHPTWPAAEYPTELHRSHWTAAEIADRYPIDYFDNDYHQHQAGILLRIPGAGR